MGDAGNHRSYVFYFLGHKFFHARVNTIVNKKEVNNWHNVKNGTYSVEDAENIFDSYFDGCKAFRGMVWSLYSCAFLSDLNSHAY